MSKHPSDRVPDEMPKDLDRVYAALETSTDQAPEALLERILASRGAGERPILPADHAPQAQWRTRLIRVAIAAGLGLVALGTWSRLSRSHTQPRSIEIAGFGVSGFEEFGFVTPAAAQGTLAPRFEPMTFDTARLHPVRLRYVKRVFDEGNVADCDTVTYSLVRSVEPSRDWIATVRMVMRDKHDTAYLADTVRLERATLRTLSELYTMRVSDGSAVDYRWTIGDSTATMHAEHRDVRYRPVPSGKERAGIDTRIIDTMLTLPETGYPRVASTMSYGAELLFKLMAAPIESGWKRSIVITRPGGTVVTEGVTKALIPVDLQMEGAERTDSPIGTVDCWKLRRHGSSAESTYLVRKSDGLLVSLRVEGKFNGRSFRSETVLIGER